MAQPNILSFPKPNVPRVLHVITPSRMAGAETFLSRLLHRTTTRLAVQGCVSSYSDANAEMQAAGMDLQTLGIGGKANLLAVPRLRRAAREFRADLLHSHLSSASWWCGWLEFMGGPRSIGHVHGFTSGIWHRRQSHLLACSAAVKSDLVEKGFAANRVTVMHYPVDPDDQRAMRSPAEVRAECGVTSNTPIIGTFAHLSIKKGYRELVRAAELVLNHMPKAQFWCFGEGPLRDEIAREAHIAGIEDQFRLFGFRRDAADFMRAVDVMCLPSHREPFGLVYVEAALAEKPVIACNAGGVPEIVLDGETGLLIEPPRPTVGRQSPYAPASNVPDLSNAILTLLDNRDRAAAMGRRGRELALARFGWSTYLEKLQEIYERVLGTHADDLAVPMNAPLRKAA